MVSSSARRVATTILRPQRTAARPEIAEPLYEYFCARMAEHLPTKTGVFGADMQIEIICDGPVTILMDTEELMKK